MVLDYVLTEDSGDVDLATADEATLRYHCFPGDIVLRIGETDLGTDYGWVPVLDFAATLQSIAAALEESDHQVFEFTESEATIEFSRENDVVRVKPSYADSAAEVPYAEFRQAADEFLARVLSDLTRTHPELADSDFVAGLPQGV